VCYTLLQTFNENEKIIAEHKKMAASLQARVDDALTHADSLDYDRVLKQAGAILSSLQA